MNAVASSILVFVCAFGGALIGMFIHRLLPDRHTGPQTQDVVRLGMGLVATTLALVLGLMVASAKSFYDTQSAEVTQLSANILLQDRLLAHYGPETAEARAVLQTSVVRQMELMWQKDGSNKSSVQLRAPMGEVLDKIQGLAPKDDRQRSLQAQALSLEIQIGQIRLLMFEQRRVPVPKPLLGMLIFWLIALFISFGMFAPPNFTVFAGLFVAAAAVCGAIFLILEMYYPYTGLIQVSDAPLRAALAQLGQ